MDYFYVGTGSPAGGLSNPYVKVKYTGSVLAVGADVHSFSLHKDMMKGDKTVLDKKLGTEVDLTMTYTMNKFTTIDLGYSYMKATKSMPFAKGQATTDAVAGTFSKTGNWLYLMINIRNSFHSSQISNHVIYYKKVHTLFNCCSCFYQHHGL
jgi:hypothetical protein